jgi:hypothetical protein
MTEEWQRQGRHFGGLIFGHQLHASIGQYVQDLELIAKVMEAHEWVMRLAGCRSADPNALTRAASRAPGTRARRPVIFNCKMTEHPAPAEPK